jgi:hypothetical protein
MKIIGTENLSAQELNFELQRGARFVVFNYCVSLVFVTLKRPTSIYFVRPGESATMKGLPFTLLTLVAGWWGIPWGPIYTVQSVYKNSRGGIDVTQNVAQSLLGSAASASA